MPRKSFTEIKQKIFEEIHKVLSKIDFSLVKPLEVFLFIKSLLDAHNIYYKSGVPFPGHFEDQHPLKIIHLNLSKLLLSFTLSGEIICSFKLALIDYIRRNHCLFDISADLIEEYQRRCLLDFSITPLSDGSSSWVNIDTALDKKNCYRLHNLYYGAVEFIPKIRNTLEYKKYISWIRAGYVTHYKPLLEKLFRSCCSHCLFYETEEFFIIEIHELNLMNFEKIVMFDFFETLYKIYTNLSPYPRDLEKCFQYTYPFSCTILLTSAEIDLFNKYRYLFSDLEYEYDFTNIKNCYLKVMATSTEQIEALENLAIRISNVQMINTVAELRCDFLSSKRINCGIALALAKQLLNIPEVKIFITNPEQRASFYEFLYKFIVTEDFDVRNFVSIAEQRINSQNIQNEEDFYNLIGDLFQSYSAGTIDFKLT